MTPAERLAIALEDLRSALCAGDLGALGPLAAQIDADLSALESDMASADTLSPLRARAVEIELLLAAAGRGLIAGRRRLAEVHELSLGLGTYDREGRKWRITPASSAPPRRA